MRKINFRLIQTEKYKNKSIIVIINYHTFNYYNSITKIAKNNFKNVYFYCKFYEILHKTSLINCKKFLIISLNLFKNIFIFLNILK